MTKAELLEVISNGENSGVEFKRDSVDSRSLAQELVALANLRGGRVLLGVANDGSIAGLTRPDLEEWVMAVCRDKISPELIPYFQVVREVQPQKDVAVVEVNRGWTAHSVWHNNHPSYYIRVGRQSRQASPEELAPQFQQWGESRVELRPVSGSSLADLDGRRLRDYFQRVRQQEAPENGDGAAWQHLLVNTQFLSQEGGATPCTVAGLLLFGKCPNRFLPHAGIDAVTYPGTQKDYAALERTSLRGPLVGLFGLEEATAGLLEMGLVEEAVRFVRRSPGVSSAVVDGVRRVARPAYPEEVIREAVVNALVHRDYLLSATNIELSVYSDRVEIASPGRLPNGITPQRMSVGCRAARNQLLKDVMRDYGYAGRTGMGVPRKIIGGMLQHKGTEPELVEDQDRETFTVRLWKERGP